MPIGEFCNREVVFALRANTIKEAASLMRQHHVGDLVVVEEGAVRKPVGIITDRDIVVSLVAQGLDPEVLTVGEVMGQDLITAPEQQGVFESIEQMRMRGIRRLPVVGKQGELIGIVAVDDLLALLAEEMGALAKIITREQSLEAKTRR
jgi:CBS domain-containing protein